MQGNGKGTLILDQARRLTPVVNPVEAMRKQLALAVYDHATEKDIGDMMGKLKEMALGGNLQAMKMWLKLTVGEGGEKGASAPEPSAIGRLADSIEEFIDEMRVSFAKGGKRPKAIGDDS
jgi:hypothetical protein